MNVTAHQEKDKNQETKKGRRRKKRKQAPAQQMRIMWRTSRQACLMCPWARYLGDTSTFMWQADGGAKQSTRSGGPSLTEDLQTERER